MRVGIIQSCYIPWRGFFDFIDDVDLFILFDDVKYPCGRSWRNRNQVKSSEGLRWLTVPVTTGSAGKCIDQVLIGKSEKPWMPLHRRLLKESLGAASHFQEAMAIWEEGVKGEEAYLSRLNERLIRNVCDYLQIRTPILRARDFGVSGEKTARLIELLKKVGGTTYLSGPVAKDYLDEGLFRDNRITLEYKVYDYPSYPQQFEGFIGTVTVLDLIANCGPLSRSYLKSRTENVVAI